MADMNDFDIEIEDSHDSDPQHFNGTISAAGTAVTIVPTNARVIRLAYISVNSVRDPDFPNGIRDAIKFSIDGGSTFATLMSGESQHVPGIFENLILDSNNDNTHFQVIVWS